MSLKEGNILFGRIIRAYLSSVISISLVLFLVGLAGLLVINARSVTKFFKENIVVSVVLNYEVSDDDAQKLMSDIEKKNYVVSTDYISKEMGTLEMEYLLGKDFLDVFEFNPIPISFDLHIAPSHVSIDSLELIKMDLYNYSQVDDVIYQETIIDILNTNLEKLGLAFLVFIILLMFISFVLINNTIRLNVYSKRFTIRTMRLVGATKHFITKPFVWKAFFQGLISSLISVIALILVLYLIKEEFYQLFSMLDYNLVLYLFAAIVILGLLLCICCTALIVRKIIAINKNDLYF